MIRDGAILILLAALAAAPARAQDETPMLRFDPFAAPLLRAPAGSSGPASPSRAAWTPTLTGVVVAGPRSVANLNGVILNVGEESHGYRLLEVRPDQAVFEREGRQVVMSLLPQDAPAEEDHE